MSNIKIARKITIADVVGRAAVKNFPNIVKETSIVRFMGIARKYTVKTTTYGESLCFVGDFHGVNLATGEVVRSTTIYLPSPVDEMLANEIEAIQDGEQTSVEFAFEVTVTADERSTVGYVYGVKNLLEVQESNPMQNLLDRVGAAPTVKLEYSEPESNVDGKEKTK